MRFLVGAVGAVGGVGVQLYVRSVLGSGHTGCSFADIFLFFV